MAIRAECPDREKGNKQMNQKMPDQELNNPWDDRAALPVVSSKHTVLAAIAVFVSALAIPLCTNEWIALGVLAILFAYVALAVRSPISVTLVLISAVLAVMLSGGSFTVGAVFLSLAVGTAACTYLMTVLRLPYLTVLLPLAAAGISFVWISDIRVSLLALVFLPAAALLAFATVKGYDRTSAICFAAAGLLLSLAAILLVLIYLQYGNLGRGAIVGYFDALRNGMIQTLASVRNELLAQMSAVVQDDATREAYDRLAMMLSDEMLDTLVSLVVNILPAMAVIVCSVIAYEAQGMLNAVYYHSGLRQVVTPASRCFTMSVVSAVIYSLTFILTLLIPTTSMASAVVQNICLILLPGFCVLGVQGIFLSLAQARGGMRVFLLLFFGSMLCCYTGGALYILAMWGAYGRVMDAIRRKLLEKMNQNGDGGENL